jgi:hypothetical protein
MTSTEPEKDEPPTAHHPWWKRVLFGAIAGAFYGALNIWFYEFSLRRLLAAIISGASFFVVLGLLAPKPAKNRSKLIAFGFSGFVAGIVYWLVARPTSSLILAMMIGFGCGIVCAWAESRGE